MNRKAREDVARGLLGGIMMFVYHSLLSFHFPVLLNLLFYSCRTSMVSVVWHSKASSRLNSILPSTKFRLRASKALSSTRKVCTYGVVSGFFYLVEALLFYVGAVLTARGLYTYLQTIQVFLYFRFIGSQLMAFSKLFPPPNSCYPFIALTLSICS